jgi:hypothetical protein
MAYVSQMLGESEAYIIQLCDRLGIQTHHDVRTGRVTLSSDDVELLRRLVQTETASRRKAYGSYATTASPETAHPSAYEPELSAGNPSPELSLDNHISVTAASIPAVQDQPAAMQSVETPMPAPPPLPTQVPATTLTSTIAHDLPVPTEALRAPSTAIRSSSMAGGLTASRSGLPSTIGSGDVSMIVETVTSAKESILADLGRILDDKLAGLDELVVELIRSKTENDALKDEIKKLENNVEEAAAESAKYKPTAFGFYRKVK